MSAIAKVRAVVVLVAIALFFVINSGGSVPKDPRQVEFESWLKRIESASPPVQTKLQEHPIRVTLSSDYPEFRADWKLETSGTPNDARVLRILQLAREGNLFSLGHDLPNTASPAIHFLVERNGVKFDVRFTREEIDGNLQAHSLFKLFEIYAGQQATPALTQQ
jgi:hypothetical protein